MGGRYLVTMITDHMEMYWGSMLIYTTFMGMFLGITLWLAVCVRRVASRQAALDPQWGSKAFWPPIQYKDDILPAYEIPLWR